MVQKKDPGCCCDHFIVGLGLLYFATGILVLCYCDQIEKADIMVGISHLHLCNGLHYTAQHYTAQHYTVQHYTALHYTAQHYTALHCTTDMQFVTDARILSV